MACFGGCLVRLIVVVCGLLCLVVVVRGEEKHAGIAAANKPFLGHNTLHTIALSCGTVCVGSDACGGFPESKLTVLATTVIRLLIQYTISPLAAVGSRPPNRKSVANSVKMIKFKYFTVQSVVKPQSAARM